MGNFNNVMSVITKKVMPKKKYTGTRTRLYYLDWLRIIALLVVFVHHCAKFFDFHTNTVYSAERSMVLSMVRNFNLLWVMPLFFIISGASVYYSVVSRTVKAFLKERFLRIVVPLLFIGTFVINPPQLYFQRLCNGETTRSFIQWYPSFFDGFYFGGGNFAPLGVGTHLWYLMYLFTFIIILLPLIIISRKTGKSVLSRVSRFFERPRALFLMFVPVSAAAVTAEKTGIGFLRMAGGWDPLTFLVFLIYGYMIFSNETIQNMINKYYMRFLVPACVLTMLYLDSHFGINLQIDGVTGHSGDAVLPYDTSIWALVMGFKGLLSWLWVIAILGLGRRLLSYRNRLLDYANEAVMPFYILHYTVVIGVGYYVVQWNVNIAARFIAVTVISFLLIMPVYEFAVKRLAFFRFLFGMKMKIKKN